MQALMRDTPCAPTWSDAAFAALLAPAARPRQFIAWVAHASHDQNNPAPHNPTAQNTALLGFLAASLLRAGPWAECELDYLVVAEAAQRRGIGRQLLTAFLSWARVSGAHAVHLELRASNHSAVALYTQAGFRRCGLRRGYYSRPEEDAILMQLVLSP